MITQMSLLQKKVKKSMEEEKHVESAHGLPDLYLPNPLVCMSITISTIIILTVLLPPNEQPPLCDDCVSIPLHSKVSCNLRNPFKLPSESIDTYTSVSRYSNAAKALVFRPVDDRVDWI